MPQIQSVSQGITYIKINKKDCSNTDYNIPLQQSQILRLQYPANNSYSDYNIIDVTDKGDYFLFKVQQNLEHSFADSEVLNYRIQAEKSSSVTINAGGDPKYVTAFSPATIDSQNYFNNTSGTINFQDTPNSALFYSISFTVNSNTNNNTGSISLIRSPFELGEPNSGTQINSHRFVVNSGNTNLLITGTFYALNQDIVVFKAGNDGTPSDFGNLIFSSFSLTFSQVYTTQSSTCKNVLIEPYFDINFNNSIYNPLINNVFELEKDTFFQIIDFKRGKDIPSNIQSILSGTAELAPVKQYNYIKKSHILPRYEGSKTYSKLYNTYTPPFSLLGITYEGDQSYSKTAAIDKYSTLMFTFDWGGGGYPQLENGGGFNLNNILNINSIDKIEQIKINDNLYPILIDQHFINDNKMVQRQIDQKNNLPSKLDVLYTNVRIPGTSNYFLPMDNTAVFATCSFSTNENYLLVNNINFSGSVIGPSGFETALGGVALNNNTQTNVVTAISSTLSDNSKRWFISIYESLNNIAYGSLNQIEYPIEILSIETSGSQYKYNLSKRFDLSSFNNYYIGGNNANSLGALIWESSIENYNCVLFKGSSGLFSQTSKGALTTENPSKIINDNFKDILTKVEFII